MEYDLSVWMVDNSLVIARRLFLTMLYLTLDRSCFFSKHFLLFSYLWESRHKSNWSICFHALLKHMVQLESKCPVNLLVSLEDWNYSESVWKKSSAEAGSAGMGGGMPGRGQYYSISLLHINRLFLIFLDVFLATWATFFQNRFQVLTAFLVFVFELLFQFRQK